MASTLLVPSRPSKNSQHSGSENQRSLLLREAARLSAAAEAAAGRGDLADAARLILQSLDCERRVGSMGPQVLQLIKPRS